MGRHQMLSHEVHSGLSTVRHLLNYFGELKINALRIVENAEAVQRGYFSTREDEQVQALLVSYWQSRAAALDLICDLRRRQPPRDPDRSAYFLLGFVTALMLVDAGRFLREQTSGRPVVRRQLNQPIPSFSIPGGTYDVVQRSLVSSRHAWHLYHARLFYDQQRDKLARLAAEYDMADLIAAIEGFGGVVDVSISDFARHSLRTRGDQALRHIGRTVFARSIYGIQKFVSEMMADVSTKTGHVPQVPPAIVDQLRGLIAPGDVLVVRKEHALTNYFLPGYWPHAALYLGTTDELSALQIDQAVAGDERWSRLEAAVAQSGRCVLEAMKDGVNLRCWRSAIGSDSLVVLRTRLARSDIAQALRRVLAHEGKGYDFDFDFGRSDRLVCTEVVYRAYEGVGNMSFQLKRRAGRPTLSGSDLVEMALAEVGLQPIAAFVPAHDPTLKTGAAAPAAIRRVLAE